MPELSMALMQDAYPEPKVLGATKEILIHLFKWPLHSDLSCTVGRVPNQRL